MEPVNFFRARCESRTAKRSVRRAAIISGNGANARMATPMRSDLALAIRVRLSARRVIIFAVLAAIYSVFPPSDAAWGLPQTEAGSVGGSAQVPQEPANKTVDHLITQLVLESLPRDYVDDRHWGKTAQRFNGVHLRREGWKIETERDWATVNHGTWKKSTIRLVDPDHQFNAEMRRVRPADDGGSSVAFDLAFETPLTAEVRQAQWVNGVQIYSISADVDARIQLTVSFELSVEYDTRRLPPDIVFHPKAIAADLKFKQFRVQRISKLGGEFAQQVTELAESHLGEFTRAQEPKIVEKINRQIDKHEADFRVSLGTAFESEWAKVFWPNELVPAGTENSESHRE